MIGMIRSGEIAPGARVLYCHLGGQPALPAYAGFPGLGSPGTRALALATR